MCKKKGHTSFLAAAMSATYLYRTQVLHVVLIYKESATDLYWTQVLHIVLIYKEDYNDMRKQGRIACDWLFREVSSGQRHPNIVGTTVWSTETKSVGY